jgi:hypothetical protein
MASAEAQSKWNAAVGQLPTNKNATVDPADPFLTAGFQALSTATGGIAQFWDRDADAEYAKAGMEGFQQFLVQPDQREAILERLEQTRLRSTRSDLTTRAPPAGGAPFRFGGKDGMAETASSHRIRRWNQRTIAPWLFLAPGLFMFTVYVLWPIVESVTLSFYDWNGLYNQDGEFTGTFVGMATMPS